MSLDKTCLKQDCRVTVSTDCAEGGSPPGPTPAMAAHLNCMAANHLVAALRRLSRLRRSLAVVAKTWSSTLLDPVGHGSIFTQSYAGQASVAGSIAASRNASFDLDSMPGSPSKSASRPASPAASRHLESVFARRSQPGGEQRKPPGQSPDVVRSPKQQGPSPTKDGSKSAQQTPRCSQTPSRQNSAPAAAQEEGMQPRKSQGGFSPPQQPQQQPPSQPQPSPGQAAEPAGSQAGEASQGKGWLGLGAPATGLLSLLRPSAGAQQGVREAVQNRERTLDWLHASNLTRAGQGGAQHGTTGIKGPKEGASTSRSLAAKAFQNSYRSRMEPQMPDQNGPPYDGPAAGWNYPGSEADASDADDVSTDAGSDAEHAEHSAGDEREQESSARGQGSLREHGETGNVESASESAGTGLARQGSLRHSQAPPPTPFQNARSLTLSPDAPPANLKSGPIQIERTMSKRMSFKIDLTNVKANMSRGQGGALSPTLMSPAASGVLEDGQPEADPNQDEQDDDGDCSVSGIGLEGPPSPRITVEDGNTAGQSALQR